MITKEQIDKIENSFTYHPPKDDKMKEDYEFLRRAAKNMAKIILDKTPVSREQSLAITKLEEAIMWANKAIACNEQ